MGEGPPNSHMSVTFQMLRLPIAFSVCLWQWDKWLLVFVISISHSPCHCNFSHIPLSLSFILILTLSLFLFPPCVCGLYTSENYFQQPPATGPQLLEKHRFKTVKQNKKQANHKGARWLWLYGIPSLAIPSCYGLSGKPR